MSTGGHKTFLNQERVAIVVGGHKDTDGGLAPDGSCNMKIKDPTTMGTGVSLSDLPFSIRERSADYWAQCSTPGLLDPGKTVYAKGDLGGKLKMAAIAEESYQPSQGGTPSNNGLLQGDFMQAIMKVLSGVNIPPDLQKKMDKGALVYEMIEKQGFSHNLLAGIPNHGAIFPLLGARLPEEKDIPTAIQKFSNILSSEAIGKLPGSIMSLGKMFANIRNNPSMLNTVTQNMPADIVDAFHAIGTLIQVGDFIDAGETITGFRVDEETFLGNAVGLLQQCRGLNDIIYVTQELLANTDLHGIATLGDITYEYETPFGNTIITIAADGTLTENVSNTIAEAAEAFASSMASASSAQAAASGDNFLGQSAKTLFEMFQRLPSGQMQEATQLIEKLNTGSAEELFKKIREITNHNGGEDPFGKIFGVG